MPIKIITDEEHAILVERINFIAIMNVGSKINEIAFQKYERALRDIKWR